MTPVNIGQCPLNPTVLLNVQIEGFSEDEADGEEETISVVEVWSIICEINMPIDVHIRSLELIVG